MCRANAGPGSPSATRSPPVASAACMSLDSRGSFRAARASSKLTTSQARCPSARITSCTAPSSRTSANSGKGSSWLYAPHAASAGVVISCALYRNAAARMPAARPSRGRCKELESNPVGVAEGDARAVMGVLDPAMCDAQLVQARSLLLELGAVPTGESDMIQTSAMLVELVRRGLGVCMQAEELPSVEGEHGVVEPARLVLVEDGCRCEQLAVPASASLEICHGYREVGDGWKVRHRSLPLDDGHADIDVRDGGSPPAIGPSSADSHTTAASRCRFRPTLAEPGRNRKPGRQLRAERTDIRRASRRHRPVAISAVPYPARFGGIRASGIRVGD